MHRYNSFLTLTLDDAHLTQRYFTGKYYENGTPAYAGTLAPRDHQLFFKRLRKALGKGVDGLLNTPHQAPSGTADRPWAGRARYYLGAEYGEQYRRPHYHVCLFGIDFADKQYLRRSPAGYKLYRSPTLEQLWPLGFSSIGELNYETAAYVARYVMKKINGDKAEKHYEVIDYDTGEILRLRPEYNMMSRRPGIAWAWLQEYTPDVYPHGKVIVNGRKAQPPRYYDKLYKRIDRNNYEDLRQLREMEASANWLDNTIERLAVKEVVAAAQISQLKRKL